MHPIETIRRAIIAAFPWFDRERVEARHADTRRVLREARAERLQADLRTSAKAISRRLDGRA